MRAGGAVQRLVGAYDPAFRSGMTVALEQVEDRDALVAAAADLPAPARDLLDLALLVGPVGDPLPDRLRALVESAGDALWRGALLLPRSSPPPGASILPMHYAAACRLNPALAGLRPALAASVEAQLLPDGVDRATFPPADARWDAVIVAALLEGTPAALREDGLIRKDTERRLFAGLGGDPERWELALRLARVQGLVRAEGGRLRGLPEGSSRPVSDPAVLFDDALEAQAAHVWLRLVGPRWVGVPALLTALRSRCRELFYGARSGGYPGGRAFDAAGWDSVEEPLLLSALDVLHRIGLVEAHRDGAGLQAVRRASGGGQHEEGFLLTPDGEILVPVGALSGPEYGRLCRLAPFIDGERLCRHRLTSEGLAADLAAGHSDAAGFLAARSRTGLPPSIGDALREWQRSASRITILTGVDILEEEDGTLRLVHRPPEGAYRALDYTPAPRARFLYQRGRITVPFGWDPLTVRAAVARIARREEPGEEGHVYLPERREHGDVAGLLDRLRDFHGGDLPGEIEALVLAGGGLEPVRVEAAVVVHVPGPASGALRRDWVAGPLLQRWIRPDQAVVASADLPALRERLEALGLRWEG